MLFHQSHRAPAGHAARHQLEYLFLAQWLRLGRAQSLYHRFLSSGGAQRLKFIVGEIEIHPMLLNQLDQFRCSPPGSHQIH